jgi:ribosomal protein S18 acetylase RimI-like enzyme
MKQSKKELRKEATKLANRIHRNISHANGIENPLETAPALAAFTSLQVNLNLHTTSTHTSTHTSTQDDTDTDPTKPTTEHDNDNRTEKSKLTIKFCNSPLPKQILDACLDLFKINMGAMYEQSSWGLNMKEKKEELTHSNARYLIATNTAEGQEDVVLAFAHFRFEADDEDHPTREALYLYEIQISSIVQRNGLGKRMMQILEIVGMQMKMRMVMLTVFKNNQNAMRFYETLKYRVDDISPSMFEEEADYEIMSKCVYKGTD